MDIYCSVVIYTTVIRDQFLDITFGVPFFAVSFFFFIELALSELFSVGVMSYSAVAALH